MPIQIFLLSLLAVASLLLFFPLNYRSNAPKRTSRLDPYIPFLPAFIVPYLGLFPFIAFAMLAILFTPIAARFYVSLIFAGLGGALIWSLAPNGVKRPQVVPNGPFTKMVAWTYKHDPRCNAFPSSHVFTAFLCSYYLAFAFPLHETLIWTCGVAIIGSTLLVKQHHVSDVVGGLVLGACAIGASYALLGGLA